jgi:hypothetical protein
MDVILDAANNPVILASASTKEIKLFRRGLHGGNVMPGRKRGSSAL